MEQGLEIDGLELHRPTVVQVGEQQEILDQATHASSRLADSTHGIVTARCPLEGSLTPEVGDAQDDGDRRAKLMGRIGDELTESRLRPPAARRA